MNGMDGNPHVFTGSQIATPDTINEGFIAEEGISFETVILSELTRNTEATLALAYEQRTANLIATLRVGAVDMTDWPQQVIDNFHRTSIEISQRMGIEGATK